MELVRSAGGRCGCGSGRVESGAGPLMRVRWRGATPVWGSQLRAWRQVARRFRSRPQMRVLVAIEPVEGRGDGAPWPRLCQEKLALEQFVSSYIPKAKTGISLKWRLSVQPGCQKLIRMICARSCSMPTRRGSLRVLAKQFGVLDWYAQRWKIASNWTSP